MRYLWRQVRYLLALLLVRAAMNLVAKDMRLETIWAFQSLTKELGREP